MIKRKMIMAHLRAAQAYAETSYAVRLQVGAVIVNQLTDQPVSAGWNGMPPGEPNVCEHEVEGQLVSKDNVVHAEINALSKIPVKIPRNFLTLFVTDSPCPVCAKQIVSSGIRQVVFTRRYRLNEGIVTLLKAGVEVFHTSDTQLKMNSQGEIYETPAEYSEANILMCENYKNGLTVKPHGLGNHNLPWSDKELDRLNFLYNSGATVDQIAKALDRSYSAICSILSKDGTVSWAANQGYMETDYKRQRHLWCSTYQIAQNRKAIEDAVKAITPAVLEAWEERPNIGTMMRKFPHIAPMFLKRICKVNNQ